MTKDWSLLQTYPSYIDKIPYTSNIDFNKSAYAQGKLWDKFVNVSLFLSPQKIIRK